VNAPRIRVLAVTNMYPTTDDPTYGVFVESQMRSIAAAGVDVRVEFIDGRRRKWRYGSAILLVRRLAASGAFDLVHAHYGLSGFVALFQPLPLIVSFCGDDLLGTPNGKRGLTAKSRLIITLSHAAARRSAALICKSEELRMRLPRSRDRARAFVIPNGVDTERFAPGDRGEARARLGLDPTDLLVLFPHTPTERRKRLDLAQAAVARLEAGGVAATLMVVQRAPPARMPDFYRAADCLIVTSDWEGSPNVVKEALCCDLPVVSVDTGDVRKWLNVVPGCQVVERDPDAIARGLAEVLVGHRRINGQSVRDALNSSSVARQVVTVYQQVLAR
jgi:glycosyltransferase involved in cell wall biosynthesis